MSKIVIMLKEKIKKTKNRRQKERKRERMNQMLMKRLQM